MGKINLFITEANGNLSNKKALILDAVKKAEEYVFSKLKIDWDIDVVITNRVYEFVIPEDGVGGRTYTSDFIIISINEDKITENVLAETLVHELCHAARWGKNDEWMNTLFDGIVSEGIATYFESEFMKSKPEKQLFLKTVMERSDVENKKIHEELKDQLGNERYDYQTIFFNGNDKLPRWSAYSLGYLTVKKYLEKSGKTIEEAFADKYADFEAAL
ncbi:hypothetical protein IKF86_02080 [Candidatus Saccharibacteria bacterium]|nr:hypothetical protein [Candidatus Saccharibacteria bacterium]